MDARKSIQSTDTPPNLKRQSLLLRTIDHSQPPVEDPNNSPQINAQRRVEYERVQQLNHMMETVIIDFEQATNNLNNFLETLHETDQLLDIWTKILSQTQHTKRILENS
ncbi:unnamed protein product [Cunninghamella blakesleeana]